MTEMDPRAVTHGGDTEAQAVKYAQDLQRHIQRVQRHAGELFSRVGYRAARRNPQRQNLARALGSANAALGSDLTTIRDFSRNLYRCSAAYRAYIGAMLRRIVGVGLRPVANTPEAEIAVEWFLNAASRRPRLDARGLRRFPAMQRMAATEWLLAGESVSLKTSAGLQDIPAERLGDAAMGLIRRTDHDKDSARIVDGIEVNEWGRPVRFHFAPWNASETSISHAQSIPYEARHVIHLAHRDGTEQIRGVPPMAAMMDRLLGIDEIVEATEVAGKLAVMYPLVWKSKSVQSAKNALQAGGGNPYRPEAFDGPRNTDDPRGKFFESGPGGVAMIDLDDTVETLDPKHPNAALDTFVNTVLRLAAGGAGIPLGLAMGDMRNLNGQQIRVSLLLAEEFAAPMRDDFSSVYCDEAFRWFVARHAPDEPELAPILGTDLWDRVRWIGPRMISPNPLEDIKASLTAVQGNLSTLEQELTARGLDISNVFDGRGWERREERARGIEPAAMPGSKPLGAVIDEAQQTPDTEHTEATGAPGIPGD